MKYTVEAGVVKVGNYKRFYVEVRDKYDNQVETHSILDKDDALDLAYELAEKYDAGEPELYTAHS